MCKPKTTLKKIKSTNFFKKIKKEIYFQLVVLNWGNFAPQGVFSNVLRHLVTPREEVLLAATEQTPGCYYTAYNTHDRPQQQRIILPQLSRVLRLKNPHLDSYKTTDNPTLKLLIASFRLEEIFSSVILRLSRC